MNVIKRAMLMVIAIKLLPESKYLEYSKYFKILDGKADGYIDREEALEFLDSYNSASINSK